MGSGWSIVSSVNVSIDIFDLVGLGVSQTPDKLIWGDSWVVRFAEILDFEFFATITMSCTDFITSKTFERKGLQKFIAFKASWTPPIYFIAIYHWISNSEVELGSSTVANFNNSFASFIFEFSSAISIKFINQKIYQKYRFNMMISPWKNIGFNSSPHQKNYPTLYSY